MMKSPLLNDGHILELQDRLHVAIEYLDMTLLNHPLVQQVDELKVAVDSAVGELAKLYQTIGQYEVLSDFKSCQDSR